MTGLNEIENVYGETVEFYDLSALSQIGNKKIVLNKFADMVKDLDGIILDIGAGTGKTTIEMLLLSQLQQSYPLYVQHDMVPPRNVYVSDIQPTVLLQVSYPLLSVS